MKKQLCYINYDILSPHSNRMADLLAAWQNIQYF